MGFLINLIPGGLIGRVIALAAFAAAVAAGYAYWHHQVDAGGYARAEGEQAQRDLGIAKRSIRVLDLSISAQQELNDAATATQKVLADTYDSIISERDRIIDGLRKLPAPTASAPSSNPAKSSTETPK